MRYHARWSNGYWKTFDSIGWRDIAMHFLEREANENAEKLNRKR